jgi:hypothetical protein
MTTSSKRFVACNDRHRSAKYYSGYDGGRDRTSLWTQHQADPSASTPHGNKLLLDCDGEKWARRTLDCRKPETEISLRHDLAALAPCHRLGPRDASIREKPTGRNFPGFLSRNPLKSLNSHERIQGNPRKPNPRKAGFPRRTATVQGNPNGSTGSAQGRPT